MNALKPTIAFRLQSSTAVHSAPLWLMNPTDPGRATVVANVAFIPDSGLITPRQFGPMMRIFAFCASTSSCRSSSAPSGPISLKPAEITIAPCTPFSPHSRISPGMEGGGVMITARSTDSGISEIVGYAFTPNPPGRLGLTGYTGPPNGLVTRFHSTVRPTVPGFSVAPMTATVLGEKNTSSGCFRLRVNFFFPGLLITDIFGICLWAERPAIEGLDYVQRIKSVLTRNSFYIAIVGGGAIAKIF